MKKLMKKLKLPGIVRRYSSAETNNIVAVSNIDDHPVFVLMIDAKERFSVDDVVDPRETARETIVYTFDTVDKIDNWIRVLNLIKDDMEVRKSGNNQDEDR